MCESDCNEIRPRKDPNGSCHNPVLRAGHAPSSASLRRAGTDACVHAPEDHVRLARQARSGFVPRRLHRVHEPLHRGPRPAAHAAGSAAARGLVWLLTQASRRQDGAPVQRPPR